MLEAQAPPRRAPLGESPARWPGVRFEVAQMERVADERNPGKEVLLVALRLVSAKEAAGPVFLGEPTGKDRIAPFTLAEAALVDDQRGTRHAALPQLPTAPFRGPDSVVTQLGPGQWVQMAVAFPAPPLLTDAQGKPLPQTVTLYLPGAARALRHLPLPIEDGNGKAAAGETPAAAVH